MKEKIKKQNRRRKILRNTGIVVLGLIIILGVFDIYGRQPFNPQENNDIVLKENIIVPGKNTVEYLSQGSKIVAHLYVPNDYKEGEKYPAIIITPPNTGVKEQTAGIYAEKLSEEGFITLAFDPRGFGESGGHPLLFDLERQIQDAEASVDFIESLELVDAEHIFNMGICVGTGISVAETVQDSRIKAQAMVSPTFRGEDENILPLPVDVAYIIAGFSKTVYNITGNDLELTPLVSEVEPEEANEEEIGVAMGAFYYLPGMPGDVPTWNNGLSMTSIVPVVEWLDFFKTAEELDETPLYMVYGTKAFSRHNAIKYYDLIDGPKDRLVIDGAGHFDLYWKTEYVQLAVEGITTFFENSMNE